MKHGDKSQNSGKLNILHGRPNLRQCRATSKHIYGYQLKKLVCSRRLDIGEVLFSVFIDEDEVNTILTEQAGQ